MLSPLYLYGAPHLLFSQGHKHLKADTSLHVHILQPCSRAKQVQSPMPGLNYHTGLLPRIDRTSSPTSSWQCVSSVKASLVHGDATPSRSGPTCSSSKPAFSLGNGSPTSPRSVISCT